MRRKLTPLDIVALWALAFLTACAAWAEACGPDLRAPSKAEYQWRGGYCEGVCRQAVSSEVFELGSFNFRPAGVSLDSIAGNGDLTLHWQTPPSTRELRLRIRSLNPFQCYRLDAVLDADSTSFTWPIRLARHLDLTSGDAALELGFLLEAVALDGTKTWVPIHLGAGSGAFEVVVMPGASLKALSWRLSPIGGASSSSVAPREGSTEGRFPAGEPVQLEIACAGHSRLRLATFVRDQPAVREFVLNCPVSP